MGLGKLKFLIWGRFLMFNLKKQIGVKNLKFLTPIFSTLNNDI